MVMPARNPAQVNRMLGGSPPGVPPANAFDMDPAELERMLGEGWTMFEDGTLAPPATPGGMNLGAQTGYNEPPPPGPAGPSLAPPQMAPAPPAGDPGMDAGMDMGMDMGMGPPSLAGPTPPGIPPFEPTPPPPDLGGVSSALPGTPPVSTGVGRDRGPSAGLGLERGGVGDFFEEGPKPDLAEPALDPFAYTQDQNRRSAQPGGDGDPGGYVGADVGGSDPTQILPPRRRQLPQGPPSRLTLSDPRLSAVRRPQPYRRP